jgi:hypothetical protein
MTTSRLTDIVPDNGLHATDWRARDYAEANTCHSATVHESHEYTTHDWAPPYEHNPCNVQLRACIGVRDESPYPTICQSNDERGFYLWTQDAFGPPDEFRICRRLIVGSHADGGTHVQTDIWKKPPREWPPGHVGDNGSGLSLSEDEAKGLRDWLNRRYPTTEETS